MGAAVRSRAVACGDCPMKLPIPAEYSEARERTVVRSEKTQSLEGLQRWLYQSLEGLHGRDGSDVNSFQTQGEMGNHVAYWYDKWMERMQRQQQQLP